MPPPSDFGELAEAVLRGGFVEPLLDLAHAGTTRDIDEGAWIECKAAVGPGESHWEFWKAIVALANSLGGVVLLGLSEDQNAERFPRPARWAGKRFYPNGLGGSIAAFGVSGSSNLIDRLLDRGAKRKGETLPPVRSLVRHARTVRWGGPDEPELLAFCVGRATASLNFRVLIDGTEKHPVRASFGAKTCWWPQVPAVGASLRHELAACVDRWNQRESARILAGRLHGSVSSPGGPVPHGRPVAGGATWLPTAPLPAPSVVLVGMVEARRHFVKWVVSRAPETRPYLLFEWRDELGSAPAARHASYGLPGVDAGLSEAAITQIRDKLCLVAADVPHWYLGAAMNGPCVVGCQTIDPNPWFTAYHAGWLDNDQDAVAFLESLGVVRELGETIVTRLRRIVEGAQLYVGVLQEVAALSGDLASPRAPDDFKLRGRVSLRLAIAPGPVAEDELAAILPEVDARELRDRLSAWHERGGYALPKGYVSNEPCRRRLLEQDVLGISQKDAPDVLAP